MLEQDEFTLSQRIQDLTIYLNTNTLWLQSKEQDIEVDLDNLLQMSPVEQLDYIQNTMQFLIENQPEDQNYFKYQQALQKLEGEVRNHIKIEQQLKLYVETTQQKLEESEKSKQELVQQSKVIVSKLRYENQKLQEQLKSVYQKFDITKFKLIQKELSDCKLELNTKNILLNDLTNKFQKMKQTKTSVQKENVYTDISFQDYYKNKLKEKRTETSIKDKKIRKNRIQGHSKYAKAPLTTNRTDRSCNLRRNDSPLLNSSRSSRKIESRTFSSERYKKANKLKIQSPGLNSSRKQKL